MEEIIYPFLNGRKKGVKVRENAFEFYFSEPELLGESGIHDILDQGRQWSSKLSQTLANGGSAIFPHTYISKCGDQIAAVVHACLDSGSDQVLALGVMHAINEELIQARTKELNGKNITDEPSWGVLGPGINRDTCWKQEFSLSHFKTLMDAEVKRRGIRTPKLIERYPSLTNRKPDELPGIEELEEIAKDSVVVVTDDLCHHGVAYGIPREEALDMNEEAYVFANKVVREGYTLLEEGKYSNYFDHWMNPRGLGDPVDGAEVLKHLLGEVSFDILDLRLIDVSQLFEGDTSPSWVAGTLVEVAVK